MKEERKIKLLKYLFPTEEIRKFMCNDLFFELSKIIPDKICMTRKNLKDETRKQNLCVVKEIINKFFDENETYKNQICKIYNLSEIQQIVEISVICFVFIKFFDDGIIDYYDLFSDKMSICYTPISIIDII